MNFFIRFSNTASSIAKSLLDGNRDHMFAEARFELMKQEQKVESLDTCIGELEQQASQRLELDDANYCGYEEARREQVRLEEEMALRERKHFETLVSETSMKWENWGDFRKFELTTSVQKLRESHAPIHLTSQIQDLQERVNCMNDSREFQEKESICSGKLSHVPSQPAVVPSPRSMLSRDRSMPPDTWNLSGTQGNVLGNPRDMLDSSQMSWSTTVQRSTGRLVARGEEWIASTTPMPMSAGRPSTMNSFLPAEIPLNSFAVLQRLQISELQFQKFPTL